MPAFIERGVGRHARRAPTCAQPVTYSVDVVFAGPDHKGK